MPNNKFKTHSPLKDSQGFSWVVIVAVVAAIGVLAALFVVRNRPAPVTTLTQEVTTQPIEQVAETVVPEQEVTEAAGTCAGTLVWKWKVGDGSIKTLTFAFNSEFPSSCVKIGSASATISNRDSKSSEYSYSRSGYSIVRSAGGTASLGTNKFSGTFKVSTAGGGAASKITSMTLNGVGLACSTSGTTKTCSFSNVSGK